MTNNYTKRTTRQLACILLLLAMICSTALMARVGGAGGHKSGGSGSSHSRSSSHSSSHSSSSSSYSSHSSSSSSGLSESGSEFVLVILVIFLFLAFVVNVSAKPTQTNDTADPTSRLQGIPFHEGLTREKVNTAFMELQGAWQVKDLRRVRKWMTDGVYQRFTAQFAMMRKLSQHNTLSNIQVLGIKPTAVASDGVYQTVDVAIAFQMDDSFVSDAYPQLNDSYEGERAMEFWTFIRRSDGEQSAKDLYHTDNCPNCGASLSDSMGEVSRCGSCNTLVNNACYDWILSEITQEADYTPRASTLNTKLAALTKNDKLFSVQRMEDIASNVFMQIMEVITGGSDIKLSRFASKEVIEMLLTFKKEAGNFVFDRLYLNEVTITRFEAEDNFVRLIFRLTATYQRVRSGKTLVDIDADMNTHTFWVTLSKTKAALEKNTGKEVSYSHECASCGAPFDDTTDERCSYCAAPVVDPDINWVLTKFEGLEAVG